MALRDAPFPEVRRQQISYPFGGVIVGDNFYGDGDMADQLLRSVRRTRDGGFEYEGIYSVEAARYLGHIDEDGRRRLYGDDTVASDGVDEYID